MNFEILEKCSHAVNYEIFPQSYSEYDFASDFLEPFRNELNRNIISTENQNFRNDLIKYYIKALEPYLLDNHESLPYVYHGLMSKKGFTKVEGIKYVKLKITHEKAVSEFNEFELFIYGKFIFLATLLDIIQESCYIFNINFLDLCKEIEFPIDLFSYSISKKYLRKIDNNSNNQIVKTKAEQPKQEIKPKFKFDYLRERFYEKFKIYFSEEDQTKLDEILKTGNNSKKKLVFIGNGNQLADLFKKHYEANFFMGCTKKKLAIWISENFQYKSNCRNNNGEIKDFTIKYLSDIMSNKKDNEGPRCMNPIIISLKDESTKE